MELWSQVSGDTVIVNRTHKHFLTSIWLDISTNPTTVYACTLYITVPTIPVHCVYLLHNGLFKMLPYMYMYVYV